jgi:hypothetical protein
MRPLQFWQLPLYKPLPRTLLPPLLHIHNALPHRLLVNAINIVPRPHNAAILARDRIRRASLGNLERGLALAFQNFHELLAVGEEEAWFDGGEDGEGGAEDEGVAFEEEDVPYSGTGFEGEVVQEKGQEPVKKVFWGRDLVLFEVEVDWT